MSAMPVERIEVGIDAGPDADDEELVQLSWRLRDKLLDLETERVDYAAGLTPSGPKSGTAVSLGTMIVALPDSAVLAAWVNLLRARVRWGSDRKATIQLGKNKLEIKGMLGERDAEPIMRWLDQHAGK